MMGANWQPNPHKEVTKRFAWWPIKTTSKKTVWLKYYYHVEMYIDNEMSHPIKSNYWTLIYTRNEWLLKQII